MAAKSTTSKNSKTRVSKRAKKSTDKKLFIAFGVLLIVIVAVVGLLYYRQSKASNVSKLYPDFVVSQECYAYNCVLLLRSSGGWNHAIPYQSYFPNGQARFTRMNSNGTITCANVTPEGRFKTTAPSPRYFVRGERVIVTEVYDCFPRS